MLAMICFKLLEDSKVVGRGQQRSRVAFFFFYHPHHFYMLEKTNHLKGRIEGRKGVS